MTRVALAALPLLLAATACTVALSPGEEQCEVAADCTERGFEGATCEAGVCVEGSGGGGGGGDPIWGCLGNVTEPEPDPSQFVELTIRLAYANGGAPVVTAVVDVCDRLDVQCTTMSPDFPKGLSTDANGSITLSVRQGFDGFVQITDPMDADLMTSRVYVGRPIVEPPKVKEIQLLKRFEFGALANVAMEQVDDTRGTAIVLAVDCQGESGSGVRLESPNADAESREFYLINQSPTVPPTATATDVDGFGGFFNLPVGQSLVRAYRQEGDVYIGESTFQILADTISYVQVSPTPQ